MSLHTAFTVELDGLLAAAGITPLDVQGNPVREPVVLAWMPAASIYFRDPPCFRTSRGPASAS
jgi:lactoylglutathione lyase